jgi:hypothetical protein
MAEGMNILIPAVLRSCVEFFGVSQAMLDVLSRGLSKKHFNTSKMTYMAWTCSGQISKGEDFEHSMENLSLFTFLQSRWIHNNGTRRGYFPPAMTCGLAWLNLHPRQSSE